MVYGVTLSGGREVQHYQDVDGRTRMYKWISAGRLRELLAELDPETPVWPSPITSDLLLTHPGEPGAHWIDLAEERIVQL
jgi:YD repeat-containing protein